MSYDFELYTSRKLSLDPPKTSDGSHIRVDGPDRVEEEDIPDNYLPTVGKKRLLNRIHLEGDLKASDQENVDAWLKAVVLETKGVLIDLQTEHFETPTTSGQIAAIDIQPSNNGWMSFHFQGGEKFYETGFADMLREIALIMPEAVPTRYGYYEPLQGKVEQGDVTDLISSFKDETDIFMKSKTPFGHIFVQTPCQKTFESYPQKHSLRREFLLCNVCFELRPKLFAQPANLERLISLFEKLCVTFDVVYAEIMQTEEWGNWFWRGLPDHRPHTMCVGRAYTSVWPDVLKTGRKIGNHHHLVSSDRFGNKPPNPPRGLIAPIQTQRSPGGPTQYASIFPFDYAFDRDTYIW